ncbi:DDE family transposase [Roseateles toxinivorans]|uniref:DDE family transposase n=1 Tax=Roseateles toxinivorans TaxID=270368 RepID=A0A4R6QUG7_9BURK|nr:DDE family transposase [Roseateles toxinivorans]
MEAKTQRQKGKIEWLRQEMRQLHEIKQQLGTQPDGQLSLTDPDARSMSSRGKATGVVGYNVQAAVNAKHHLIVTHEVTNIGNERAQLSPVAQAVKKAMGQVTLEAVADRGCYSGQQIKDCDDAGITVMLPKPMTSGASAEGRFDKADFVYITSDNEYRCPAGQRAIYRFSRLEGGLLMHRYWSSACGQCPMKAQCTPSQHRRISRWEHESVLEAVQQMRQAR